jgi:hypothetical protein
MAIWFLCKIRYQKQAENGKQTTINESYLIDSVSFTEAETRIYQELSSIIKDFNLVSVRPMRLTDVFHYEDAETWFKCKVNYVSVDEKSGKEKKVQNTMLVSALNVKQAYERIEESLKSMLVPFEISDVNITNILEIFPYIPEETKVPANFRPLAEVQAERNLEQV